MQKGKFAMRDSADSVIRRDDLRFRQLGKREIPEYFL